MTSAMAAIPSTIDEVTPAWLTDALPGPAVVTAVQAERIAEDSGFSALLYRLHLTGNRAVPSTLIVKLPAESEARGAMELLGGYRKELEFYREVAPAAPISTARCHVARIAEGSADFVLVLEDLHDVGEAQTLTHQQAVQRIVDHCDMFEKIRFDLNLVVAGDDGEHVVIVYESPMTLKDGTEMTISSMEIFRVRDGRITEVWNCGYKQGVWA